MTEPTVSAGIARGLAAFAATKGADPAALYREAGIDPATLDDADNRALLAHYKDLMHAAQTACDLPALGLLFGEAVDMSEVSIVGLIMNASETMGDAFAQMQRFGALAVELDIAPGAPRFQLAQRGVQLWMTDTRPAPTHSPNSPKLPSPGLSAARAASSSSRTPSRSTSPIPRRPTTRTTPAFSSAR